MGLFEYLCERKNLGNVGTIQNNKKVIKHISIPLLFFKFLVSTLIVYGLFHITVLQSFNFVNMMIFIIIIFAYCILSYKFIPRPDSSNIGLLGGLIDNPFRFTDDLNRILVVLFALMYPGRFISTTVIQTLMLFKRIDQKKKGDKNA